MPFDQRSPGKGVAGLGDAAPPHRSPARMLRRRQAEIGHQLARIGETGKIAYFGSHGNGNDQSDAAHGLQSLHHRRHRPLRYKLFDLPGQPLNAIFGVGDGVDIVLQHDLLSGVIKTHRGQPTPVCQGPAFLAGINTPMA